VCDRLERASVALRFDAVSRRQLGHGLIAKPVKFAPAAVYAAGIITDLTTFRDRQ
jgi:hypothetical protein